MNKPDYLPGIPCYWFSFTLHTKSVGVCVAQAPTADIAGRMIKDLGLWPKEVDNILITTCNIEDEDLELYTFYTHDEMQSMQYITTKQQAHAKLN